MIELVGAETSETYQRYDIEKMVNQARDQEERKQNVLFREA